MTSVAVSGGADDGDGGVIGRSIQLGNVGAVCAVFYYLLLIVYQSPDYCCINLLMNPQVIACYYHS